MDLVQFFQELAYTFLMLVFIFELKDFIPWFARISYPDFLRLRTRIEQSTHKSADNCRDWRARRDYVAIKISAICCSLQIRISLWGHHSLQQLQFYFLIYVVCSHFAFASRTPLLLELSAPKLISSGGHGCILWMCVKANVCHFTYRNARKCFFFFSRKQLTIN